MVVVDWLTDCCKELAEVTQKDWTCYLFFWLSSQTFFTSYSRSRHISLYRVHRMKHWCASSVPRPLSQTMWSPHQFCIDGLWAANHLAIIWLSLLQCICLWKRCLHPINGIRSSVALPLLILSHLVFHRDRHCFVISWLIKLTLCHVTVDLKSAHGKLNWWYLQREGITPVMEKQQNKWNLSDIWEQSSHPQETVASKSVPE